MRKIIVNPPITVSENGVYIEKAELNFQDIRLWSIFFNEIDWPQNNFIHIESSSAELDFLKEEGLFKRSQVEFRGISSAEDVFIASTFGLYEYYEKSEPGIWSIAQGERSLTLTGNRHAAGRGFTTKLINAIPIPTVDVPLEDIILFKQKRSSEILALWGYLGDLQVEVANAQDKSLAEHVALTKLQVAINDYTISILETKNPLRMATLSLNFNLTTTASISGLMTYALTGDPIQSLEVGGASFGANIAIEKTFGFTGKTNDSPFEVISHYNKDIFGG